MRFDAGWVSGWVSWSWSHWMLSIGFPYILPGYINPMIEIGPLTAMIVFEPGRSVGGRYMNKEIR